MIRTAVERDIAQVVALHHAALRHTLNSRLGFAHLERIYTAMLHDRASIVNVATAADDIIGVVSATLDPASFKRRTLASIGRRDLLSTAAKLCTNPAALRELLQSWRTERPVIWNGQIITPALTTIAVDEKFRRRGLGEALIATIDRFFLQQGRRFYRLDTRSDAARQFYKRTGFVEAARRGPDSIYVRQVVDDRPSL